MSSRAVLRNILGLLNALAGGALAMAMASSHAADAAAVAATASAVDVTPVVPVQPLLPAVRFAPESDYGPFVYRDADGRVRGLSVDLLNRVAMHAGLSLQVLPARPLAEILAGARRGEVDVITSLRPTPERAAFLGFTRPYVQVDAIVVGRSGGARPDLGSLDGRAVAVGSGYAVEAFVRSGYPRIRWQPVADDHAALKLLRAGHVDAVVADVASVHFIRTRERWSDLALGRSVGFSYPLSFAWRKDMPALGAALEAGLTAMTPAERAEVLARWLPPEALEATDDRRTPLMLAGGAALLLGAGLVLAARRRRRRLTGEGA
ncbi:transporter substrate-binding domain-containing protein [Leptothrix sp. BB-4]